MKRRFAPAAIVITAALTGCLSAASAGAASSVTGQLPPGVVPLHYDIRVDPGAEALIFTGQEKITIQVAKPTATITLNAADLTVGGISLDGARAAGWLLDPKSQRLMVRFARPIAAGTHRLAIGWTGKIAQSAAGLFAIDYADKSGPKRMLATQFEASDGRRFAPMWDEPGLKATFTLATTEPKGETAFSNMPVASRTAGPVGKTLVTFQPTPKMSSYLLFLGIGDVERRTTRLGDTEIGVITRRGAVAQGDYALASAKRLLAYYNEYFGTPYPLPKLDMIAAPGNSQFFGAMENWGAIFYFERDILIDPAISTATDQQEVFSTVAHEMAHQWFGDLVTMRWWDDIWLNEGFASWMAGKSTSALNPDWHYREQGIADSRQAAFQTDSRTGTHPIVQHVDTPDQVSQAFDGITYSKGSAVIRMLEGAVGADPFREGVRRYMAAHKYSNTVTDDLWASVSVAAGRPVKPLMDAFTLQSGVPLIRVGEPACVGGATTVTLAQDRYGTDDASKAPRRWPVPVALTAGSASAQAEVSGPALQPARVTGCGRLIVNPSQYGYYRTLYAPGSMEALDAAFGALPLADQVGTMGDRANLADAGYVSVASLLALLDHVPADADPLTWRTEASLFQEYDHLLDGDPVQPSVRAKVIARLSPVLDRVGLQPRAGEAPPTAQLRETLIATLGRMGDPRVVSEARRRVAGGMDRIPPAIRAPLVTVFAENASAADWDMLHKTAQNETNPLVRAALYRSLGAASDPTLAQRALDLALTDEAPVPLRATIVASVSARQPALTFDWAAARRERIQALVEPSSRQQLIPALARESADPALADRVEAFMMRNVPADARRSALATIATVRFRAAVKARVAGPLATWARTS